MTATISTLENIVGFGDGFDSREVIERIAELDAIEEPDEYDVAELAALRALAAEVEPYCADWQYGEQFIRDDRFEDHAQQLAEDIGAIPTEAAWPATYIDWTAAAAALRQDYTSVEIDGETYWYR